MGFLAWLVSDMGIKAVGLVAGAIYGAIKAKQGVAAGKARKMGAAETLAHEVFRTVEGLATSGKLDQAIKLLGGDAAARAAAKWTRGATLFAAGFRARHGRAPTAGELELARQVIERAAGAGS